MTQQQFLNNNNNNNNSKHDAVIIKPVIKIDKEGRTDRIVNTLNKFRARGLTVVADYLLIKSK